MCETVVEEKEDIDQSFGNVPPEIKVDDAEEDEAQEESEAKENTETEEQMIGPLTVSERRRRFNRYFVKKINKDHKKKTRY